MRIFSFPAGMFQTNCYIVAEAEGSTCVIIDPGQEALTQISSIITSEGLRPKAVLLTHGHLDHMWTLEEVCERYGLAAYIHPNDREMLTNPGAAMSMDLSDLLGNREFKEPAEVIELFDGDKLKFDSLEFDVDHVPGHSRGSVSFRCEATINSTPTPIVFGGDVLFNAGIGRTDLRGGDHAELLESIDKKFMTLPDDTVVLSGHGPATTVGRERASNPFLR